MGVKVRERPIGSGIYWILIDHRGKRKAKKIGTDKKRALEVAKKIEAKLTLKEFNIDTEEKKKVATFGEYAQTWITVTVPATCKPSTLRDYQGMLKLHILPVFGRVPVTEINRLMIKKFLMGKINAGLAASTVTHMKNAMGGTLNLTVDDEVLPVNPAHRLGRVFKNKGLKIEVDPLNREELSLLLEIFREHFPVHYPMALTLARTGMRIGEAMALQWGDVDFHCRFIHIQRGFSRGKIETPKSGKARKVDMSLQLKETLMELKHQRKVEAVRKGWGKVPEWVFLSQDGTHLDSSHWRSRVFNKALEKAGLRKIRIHDLRHTYASLLIQAGESLAYVRDQLGHHSIKVTVDVYGHLAPEGKKEAVDRLDDASIRNLYATRKEKGVSLYG